MSLNKFFRRTTALLTIVACSLFAEAVEAETQLYEGIGVYTILKDETPDFAKKQAKLDAERNALEQIYLYVKSQSASKNSKLTRDEIITVAAGKMNVLKTTFAMNKDAGNLVVTATVTAEIDPDEIPEAVERERQRRLRQN